MLDGTYDVKLSTPMGVKKGELTLASSGQVLNGTMLVMGKTNSFEGTTNENSFCFEGELKTAVGLLAYTCEGSVKDHALSGVVTTKKGKFTLGGTRK